MKKITVTLLVVGCWVGIAAASEISVLEDAFHVYSNLYNAQAKRFMDTRDKEDAAIARYSAAIRSLDQAISDNSVPITDLRRLEIDVAEARAVMIEWVRESASVREQLYRSLDYLDRFGSLLENTRNRDGVKPNELDGSWRVEVPPNDNFGIIHFKLDGAVVSGTYQMSNGSHGSLQGSLQGNSLRLERIDSRSGRDSTLRGQLNPKEGVIEGTWQGTELGAGVATSGTWTARKLAPGEDAGL